MLDAVAAFEFLLGERGQCVDGLAFVGVVTALQFSCGADTARFVDQRGPAKQIALDGH